MSSNPVIYPQPLSITRGVGVTAPSSGVAQPSHLARLNLMIEQWKATGFDVVEGRCLRSDHKHVSGSASDRARDFLDLWRHPKVGAIIPPWGGELLIEILPLVDFDELRCLPPKWVIGYSDVSTLLFALTMKTGIATAHGSNFMDLIEGQAYGVKECYLRALDGKLGFEFSQISFERYQSKFTRFEDRLDAPFNLDSISTWKTLDPSGEANFSGRIVGGCLDTLVHLVGTPFGDLQRFRHERGGDPIVLYLENCELSPSGVFRSLTQMRLSGFFDGLTGIVFGRSNAPDATGESALNYREAIEQCLAPLGIPVVLDADVGHRPPQMIVVNGAWAKVKVEAGRGELAQTFKA